MTLKTLPILPTPSTDLVAAAYFKELKALQRATDLPSFQKRWQSLFLLEKESGRWPIPGATPQTLAAYNELCGVGTFNFPQAWLCLSINTGEHCDHAHYTCTGMHLKKPLPLARAERDAKTLKISQDMALIRINGGLGALT